MLNYELIIIPVYLLLSSAIVVYHLILNVNVEPAVCFMKTENKMQVTVQIFP